MMVYLGCLSLVRRQCLMLTDGKDGLTEAKRIASRQMRSSAPAENLRFATGMSLVIWIGEAVIVFSFPSNLTENYFFSSNAAASAVEMTL
jgi:hypothetical protein